MKLRLLLLISVSLLSCALAVRAQTADAGAADAPAPGSTVITADELHSDQLNHVSIFNGNVLVVGSSFNMTCDQMKVLFTKDGKVEHITATGNVVITQPGRVTHSGQCDYYSADDRFVLTDSPVIVDNGNQLSAAKITIYRTTQTLTTEGRMKSIIHNGVGSSSGSSTPAPVPAGPLPTK